MDASAFTNISTFIPKLAEVFNLKGLTVEVFISKWNYLYGPGTTYGCELFTSFLNVISSAYCGSYIVNQKQIERSCGTHMVSLATTLLRIGAEVIGVYAEAFEVHSKNTEALANNMKLREEKAPKFTKDDMVSTEAATEKAKSIKKYYIESRQENKLSKYVLETFDTILGNISDFDEKILPDTCSILKNCLNEHDSRIMTNRMNDKIRELRESVQKTDDKEAKNKYATRISSIMDSMKYI